MTDARTTPTDGWLSGYRWALEHLTDPGVLRDAASYADERGGPLTVDPEFARSRSRTAVLLTRFAPRRSTKKRGHRLVNPAESVRQPWEWRLAYNHAMWDRDGRPTFHAHDVNDLAACRDSFGLVQSTEQPNEGSHLCPDCTAAVRREPQGRPSREQVPGA